MFQRRQKSPGPVARYGLLEVLDQVEAEPLRHAARDVGVGRKVGVDLDRKREHAGPQHEELGLRQGEHLVRDHADVVGDHELLEEAPHDQHRRVARGRRREPPLALELRQQVGGPHDRAGHQVRKERDEGRDVDKPRPGRRVPAIDVDGVAHRLEGVERDADRQRHAQRDVRNIPAQALRPRQTRCRRRTRNTCRSRAVRSW